MPAARISVLLLGLAVLSACQSANTDAITPQPAFKAATANNDPDPAAAKPQAKTVTAARVTPTPQPVPAEPPRIYPEASVLNNSSPDQLKTMIGNPDFIRKDKPAQFWQYWSSSCRLDLILYENAKNGPLKVNYFNTEPQQISAKDCLASLIEKFESRSR